MKEHLRTMAGLCLLLLAALGATTPQAAALPAEPIRSLTIPGTPRTLAGSLGIDGNAIERPRYMLELVRQMWGWNGGVFNQAVFDRLYLQVKGLQRLQKQWFDARGRDNAIGLEDARSNGRVRDLLSLLGLKIVESKPGRLEAVPDESSGGQRARDAIMAAGFDMPGIAAKLNRGERLRFSLPSFTVPLPLAPGVWTREILHKPVELEWLFAAILAKREASLFYFGLMSLDPDTLAYVAGQPGLIDRILTQRVEAFAVYGRSLHVRAGRIVVAGDRPEAVRLWEQLVGEKVTEPARFIDRLLGTADGRLAYFYDIVEHLDGPHREYVLGAQPGVAAYSPALVQPIIEVLSQPDPALDISKRPFRRPTVDLFIVLSSILVTPDGRLAPPSDPRTWAQLFPEVAQDRALTAGTVAKFLLPADPGARRARLRIFLFAQRVFGNAPPEMSRQVVEALRWFERYPLLYAVLERIGVRKPDTYSAVAMSASRLGATRDPEVAALSLSQFQGAIAVLDRCVFTGRLAPDVGTKLVERLIELQADPDGGYGGRIAGWLTAHLLPALAPDGGKKRQASPGREVVLLRALAGAGIEGRAGTSFAWRDAEYVFDAGESDFRRLAQVRKKQGGNGLDRALDLADLAAELRSPQRSVASVRPVMAAMLDLLKGIDEGPLPKTSRRVPTVENVQALLTTRLADVQPAGLRRLDEVAASIDRLVESLLAATLRSIVYAVHIGDAEGPALLDGDAALRHEFGSPQLPAEVRQSVAWTLAAPGGAPFRATGSLLALDLALWEVSYRGLSNEPPSARQLLTEENRVALGRSVPLFNPFAVTDDDVRWIGTAIERGRGRVEAAVKDAGRLRALGVEAGLGEWTVNALAWAVEFDPEAARGAFGLSHLLRLGEPGGPGAEPGVRERWGTSWEPITGCLALRALPAIGWETFADRPDGGYLALQGGEMTLQVARWLGQMKLPAALARDILPAAMQDLRDGVRLAYWGDGRALVRYAAEYPETRFSELVSTLADSGVVVMTGRQ